MRHDVADAYAAAPEVAAPRRHQQSKARCFLSCVALLTLEPVGSHITLGPLRVALGNHNGYSSA